jgi:glycosyltransferase involved in cell wall biosynthesis
MNKPRISIITATFNSVTTLADSLASIEQQSYDRIESLVIDGGSTDGTQALIAHRFGRLVNHLVSEPDRGIYDALNKGILAASGDIVGLLHSDDVLASAGTLETVAKVFHDNPAVEAVYGDLVYVRREAPDTLVRLWRSRPFAPKLLQRGWMPPHPTLYLRRSVFDRVGLFDTRYKIAADYEHVLRVFSKPGLVSHYLPQVMVKMKIGGASNKSLANLMQKSREDYRAMQSHGMGGFTTLVMKNLDKIGQFRVPPHARVKP